MSYDVFFVARELRPRKFGVRQAEHQLTRRRRPAVRLPHLDRRVEAHREMVFRLGLLPDGLLRHEDARMVARIQRAGRKKLRQAFGDARSRRLGKLVTLSVTHELDLCGDSRLNRGQRSDESKPYQREKSGQAVLSPEAQLFTLRMISWPGPPVGPKISSRVRFLSSG